MRVVLTDDVADDARALLRRTVVAVRQLLLREQDAPVYRFQAVADIRDGRPMMTLSEYSKYDLRISCSIFTF